MLFSIMGHDNQMIELIPLFMNYRVFFLALDSSCINADFVYW